MRSLFQACYHYRRLASFPRACAVVHSSLSFVTNKMHACVVQANGYEPWRRYISTSTSKVLPWEASSRETLLRKIDSAMKDGDGNVEEALHSFGNYKKLHDLPEPQVLNSLIVSLSYMSSRRWLQRAFDMVLSVHQINSNLLN